MSREMLLTLLEEQQKIKMQLLVYLSHGLQLDEKMVARYNELLILIRSESL